MNTRPPYRSAAGAALLVLLGYILTLAPTVTFWDAGEFITAARTLGIPHPPGTPLFVLVTSVWGRFIPLGEFAWRINLFSAACTAAAAGCWFLVVHDTVRRMHREIDDRSRDTFALLGALSAALLVSFSFTAWQSATETEVYAPAMLIVALTTWMAVRWRACRREAGGPRLLLLAIYLAALGVGTHLMALLALPTLIAALAVESWASPLEVIADRRSERAQIGMVAALWLLLVGVGLGHSGLIALAVLATLAATAWAVLAGRARFALMALAVVAVGLSTLAFLYLRARQHPWLNSGSPDSWQGLLEVVRRAQYPPRGPLDDPTVLHGPGNPGRTLEILFYQLANYVQYFDWQWAASLGDLARASIPRLAVTLLMISVGLRGAFAHRRADRTSFALVAMLFVVAGPGLLLYLNFKPGPSIGTNVWPSYVDHEVRDRDYFFVASFVAWGLWVAIGLVEVARELLPRVAGRMRRYVAVSVFAVALLPVVLTFGAATRRQTPERTLARDFAHALLGSVPQDAILFTGGDNDSFPLWYAQQVEGFRPDVTVIALSLTPAGWYIRQLAPLYDLPPGEVVRPPFRTPRVLTLDLGVHGAATIPQDGVVTPADILVFEILRKNAGRRPVAWSISAADALYGLAPHLVQRGLALILPVEPVDTATLVGGAAAAPGGTRLDLPATRQMIERDWNFGDLERKGPGGLDGSVQAVAGTIATPITQAGIALAMRGDTVAAIGMWKRSAALGEDSLAKALLRQIRPR